MKHRILVIEDDPAIRSNLVEILGEEGFEVMAAENGADGVALALARRPDLAICDITMPILDGYGVLRAVREHPSTASLPFIFLTAKAERSDVRTGMTLGADDYLTKPFTIPELLDAVQTRLRRMKELVSRAREAVERAGAAEEVSPPQPFSLADGVVVLDARMKALYEQAAKAAAATINVLILGETGVGKEILARAVHNLSARSAGPFLALNCAALTETLLEAELFGHEKGSFTGALAARAGLFESASGGTVFLDEVGELPLSIQTKLLRVLEERRVMRVGARAAKDVDVRFVAATNRDLETLAQAGQFREDLFYRLNGISFTIPPLRERRAEIQPLCRMFLARACAENNRSAPVGLSAGALALLESYAWPGNVRELRNVIERGVVLCSGAELFPEHLPEKIVAPRRSFDPSRDEDPRARAERELLEIERKRVLDALERCNGNQTRAAEMLGMSRRTLVYRLTELSIPRPRKRD